MRPTPAVGEPQSRLLCADPGLCWLCDITQQHQWPPKTAGDSAEVTSVGWSSAAQETLPMLLGGGNPSALWKGRAQSWWQSGNRCQPGRRHVAMPGVLPSGLSGGQPAGKMGHACPEGG